MKNIILVICIFYCFSIQAQSIIITPSGLRASNDTSKGYIILTDPKYSAKLLFNASINYIKETYKNPDLVIKARIDSEYIRYEFFSASVTEQPFKGWGSQKVNCTTSIELRFKDGKIKYEILDWKAITESGLRVVAKETGSFKTGKTIAYIYNSNGELKNGKEKQDLENLFNRDYNGIASYLTKNSIW